MSRLHFLALDGLRGVAALAVVVYHRRWLGPDGHAFDHGFLAVSFFFVLSGLVIDHAYRERLQGIMTLGRFILTRVIRLYPLIILGAILGTLLQLYLKRTVAGEYLSILSAFPFTALALPAPDGLLAEPFKLNPPTWSLFNELIANLVFATILYRLSSRTLLALAAIASATLVWMAFSVGTINSGYRYGEIANGLIATAAPFMIGMLLNRIRFSPPPFLRIPFWLASVILLITFAIPTLPTNVEPIYQLILALLFYPALILLVKTSDVTGPWRKVAYVSGYISYPVYALHYPLLAMFDRVMEKVGGSSVAWLAVMTLGSVLIAAIISFLVEEPVRRWLSQVSRYGMARTPLPESSVGGHISQ